MPEMEGDRFDRASAEMALLRAMGTHKELKHGVKCDRILRQALKEIGKWCDASEDALCNRGDEDEDVWQMYSILRQLVVDGFAEGAGNLRLPSGPRYTECKIAAKGLERLRFSQLDNGTPSRIVTAKIIGRSRGEPNPIFPKDESTSD